MSDFLYINSDNPISFTVISETTGLPVNDATITYAIKNADYTSVAGGSGSLAFVANGVYSATILAAITSRLINGQRYFIDYTITSPEGNDFDRQTVTAAYAGPNMADSDCPQTITTPATAKELMNWLVPYQLDTNVFGEIIIYTPKGGAPENITAVVERGEDLAMNANGDGYAKIKTATIYVGSCLVADVYDTFTIDSLNYAVDGRPDDDGFGMKTYRLKAKISTEKSSGDYRMGA